MCNAPHLQIPNISECRCLTTTIKRVLRSANRSTEHSQSFEYSHSFHSPLAIRRMDTAQCILQQDLPYRHICTQQRRICKHTNTLKGLAMTGLHLQVTLAAQFNRRHAHATCYANGIRQRQSASHKILRLLNGHKSRSYCDAFVLHVSSFQRKIDCGGGPGVICITSLLWQSKESTNINIQYNNCILNDV